MKPHSAVLIALFLMSCVVQAQPSIASSGVVSAAAFGDFRSIAPGSWIEIYGSNLAVDTRSWTTSDFNGVNAPTSLDGTSVTISGQLAFIDYISPTQVNAQVPSNIGTGTQSIIITANHVASGSYNVTVNAEEPGLLAPSSFDIGGTQYVAALFSDGTTYVLPPGAIGGVTSRRAVPGDTITLYGVGFGSVIPSIPAGQIVQQNNSLSSQLQIMFGQTPATGTYDGLAPNAVGLYQFDVVVPNVPSSDTTPLTFTLGGVAGTQKLYVAVQSGNSGPAVQGLTLSPTSVSGGGTVQGTVTLSQPAPAGGAIVALSSNSSAATVPSTVAVPAAATSASFIISASWVSANHSTTITASYGGTSAQATLTITASIVGGTLPQFSLITFSLSYSAGGETSVTSSGYIARGLFGASGYGGGEFTASFGVETAPVSTFMVEFNSATFNGQVLTVSSVNTGPESVMENASGMKYGITSASIMTITLNPQAVPQVGSVTGTFNLVSALATLNGTISGTYTAQ